MMAPLSDLLRAVPEWVKLFFVVGGLVVTLTLAYAALGADVALLHASVAAHLDTDQRDKDRIEAVLLEIKAMLKEELDRHHPRRQ